MAGPRCVLDVRECGTARNTAWSNRSIPGQATNLVLKSNLRISLGHYADRVDRSTHCWLSPFATKSTCPVTRLTRTWPSDAKAGLLSPSLISFFSATLTADRDTHECTVENLASGNGGGCIQPIVHFLSAAQRFLHVFADVLGADEVRKFGLLDEL